MKYADFQKYQRVTADFGRDATKKAPDRIEDVAALVGPQMAGVAAVPIRQEIVVAVVLSGYVLGAIA